MTPEELFEEILELRKGEREELFGLIRTRPELLREWEVVGRRSPAESVSTKEVQSAVDSSADYLIIWDGGSRGNPGKGYGSYKLTKVKSGKSRLKKLKFPARRMTNNEAEYETLISALDTLASKLREHGNDPKEYSLDLRGDSLLVISQVTGKWRAKNNRMATYRNRVRELLKHFGSYTLRHHDRSYSVAALGH